MSPVVLDASAVLALLRQEEGADFVARRLDAAMLSAVNYQEVLKELIRRGISLESAMEIVDELQLEIVGHDVRDAQQAAALYPLTRDTGCSLGDRTCLALARTRNVPALTADRAWGGIAVEGLEILQIRS